MCVHLIKEKADGKCPHCRALYSDDLVRIRKDIDKEVMSLLKGVQDRERAEQRRLLHISESRKVTSRHESRRSHSDRPKKLEVPTFDKSGSSEGRRIIPKLRAPRVAVPKSSAAGVTEVVDLKLTRFTGGISVWD
jgi:hypothetical protein